MTTEKKKEGLLPGDPDIKFYKLYTRGDCWTPSRFWDYLLVDTRRPSPYEEQKLFKDGWIVVDLENVIKRFDGISFEFLAN